MREKKFTRIAAFLLCLTMLLGNAVVLASASDLEGSEGSITDVTLEELRDRLNAITYEEYSQKNVGVPKATTAVQIPIEEYVTKNDGFKMEVKDGVNALFTPQTGSVTWTVNVPTLRFPAFSLCHTPWYGVPERFGFLQSPSEQQRRNNSLSGPPTQNHLPLFHPQLLP